MKTRIVQLQKRKIGSLVYWLITYQRTNPVDELKQSRNKASLEMFFVFDQKQGLEPLRQEDPFVPEWLIFNSKIATKMYSIWWARLNNLIGSEFVWLNSNKTSLVHSASNLRQQPVCQYKKIASNKSPKGKSREVKMKACFNSRISTLEFTHMNMFD